MKDLRSPEVSHLHITAVLVWLLDIHILCMNISKTQGQLQLTKPDSAFILVFVSG